jgi:hypothetical protein
MGCPTYNVEFLTACLNGDPGMARLYIADYQNILTITLDTTGVILSGITATGQTAQKAFYRIELLQDVGASVDTPTVSVPNGVAISIPSVKFKLAQVNKDTLNAFNQLKRSKTVVVYENIDGVLFAVGIKRGLFFASGTAGTDETTFEGDTIELKGKEQNGIYILSDSLQTSFVTTFVV